MPQSFRPQTMSSMFWLERGSPDSTIPAQRIQGLDSSAGTIVRSERPARGAVTVENTPGKGSIFHLYVPAAKVQAVEEDQSARAQRPPGPGQRVLYVDDEEALVFLATRVLSRLGHGIDGFTDQQEALAAFRAHPQDYDIVVTDLSMPQMSVFELAREVLAR